MGFGLKSAFKKVKHAVKSVLHDVSHPVSAIKDAVGDAAHDISHPMGTLKKLDDQTFKFRKGTNAIKDKLLGETKDLLQGIGLAAPDPADPGPVIPMVDEEAVKRAKKRGIYDAQRRAGRSSTMLSQGDGSGTLLG